MTLICASSGRTHYPSISGWLGFSTESGSQGFIPNFFLVLFLGKRVGSCGLGSSETFQGVSGLIFGLNLSKFEFSNILECFDSTYEIASPENSKNRRLGCFHLLWGGRGQNSESKLKYVMETIDKKLAPKANSRVGFVDLVDFRPFLDPSKLRFKMASYQRRVET